VRRLSEVRDEISEARGSRTPLLVKLDGGAIGDPIPAAVTAARVYGLDGIVLVSDRLRRIEEIRNHMAALTLISVGGIQTSADIRARLVAGASLVQMHRAFADGGKQLLLRDARRARSPDTSSTHIDVQQMGAPPTSLSFLKSSPERVRKRGSP
jgi:dihydroorotate dehydrogenase